MLDARHDRPLYRQLTDQLRREVARLRPGERIASEPELMRIRWLRLLEVRLQPPTPLDIHIGISYQ